MKAPNITKGPWAARFWAEGEEAIQRMKSLGMEPNRTLLNDGAMPVMPITDNPEIAGRICLVDCHTKFKRGQGYLAECAERDANAKMLAAAPMLAEALNKFSIWNRTYPSSRIYNETTIRKIAKELDAIYAEADAALKAAGYTEE